MIFRLSDVARGLDMDFQVPSQVNRRALVALSEKIQWPGKSVPWGLA